MCLAYPPTRAIYEAIADMHVEYVPQDDFSACIELDAPAKSALQASGSLQEAGWRDRD